MGEPLLLIGAGGHARACLDVIEQEQRYAVIGLIATAAEIGGRTLGYDVLGSDEDLPAVRARCGSALVAIGQIKNVEPRVRSFERLLSNGFALATVISPRAYVSPHARIGAGTIIMHGAIVNAGAVVGDNCIVNTRALIEHDAVVSDHCHISTCATLNGGVRVGAGTFIGSGSAIREGVTIGERSLIGMGQQVLADCAPGSRLASRPAA